MKPWHAWKTEAQQGFEELLPFNNGCIISTEVLLSAFHTATARTDLLSFPSSKQADND